MDRKELQPSISRHEAQKLCDEVRSGLTTMVTAMIKLHDSNGWMLLHDNDGEAYRSWGKCVEGEFGRTKEWANEQIRIAQMSQRISPLLGVSSPKTPVFGTGVARELSHVPDDKQPGIYEAALGLAGSKPHKIRASHVKRAVEELLDDETTPEAIDVPSKPVKDSDGKDVPPELWDVFSKTEDFKELNRLINKAKLLCRPLGESPAGLYLDGEACFKRLSLAQHAAKLAQPHSVCRDCNGSGCNKCGGNGWLITTELTGPEITEKQAMILQKRKIDTAGMTRKEASRQIDDIAITEGWPVTVKDAHK